jgi:hypothetical protein
LSATYWRVARRLSRWIEVIAGFVAALNIDQQLHAVFFNRQQGWRQFARYWP